MYYQQSDEIKKKVEKIITRFEKMKSDRTTFETHWQDCMDLITPRKGNITRTGTPGEKKSQEVYDSTAINANQLLAGALHSMLTNPSSIFFELTAFDQELNKDEEVVTWLQDTSMRIYTTLNNSNFQTEIHEVYLDLGSIGTSALYTEEHDTEVVRFGARPMQEIYAEENNLGYIDTVYRSFKWKGRQILQEFGESLPDELEDEIEKRLDEDFCILHTCEPRSEYVDVKSKIFPIVSCYILLEHNILLSEKGYHEFPYAVPRWTKTTGETYGRGPGMDALPDIQMINSMAEVVIKGAQKTVDPPLMVSDDGVIGKVRLTPGGLTVIRPSMIGGETPIRPLITDARIDFGLQLMSDVRQRIRSHFFVDQLQLQQGPQMTATEVNQRTEEKLRLMGPVLGRQHYEFLRPVIERVFNIMARRGLLAPMPRQLAGKKFDIRYSSMIAKVQRMSDGNNLARALGIIGPIAQFSPSSVQVIDGDKAIRYVLDKFGVPQEVMRSTVDLRKMREQVASAQQEAMKQQQESHQADVVAKVAPAVAQVNQQGM